MVLRINRAWNRSKGRISELMEADNTMQQNQVEYVVDFFPKIRLQVILWTSHNIMDSNGMFTRQLECAILRT